jgi:hypothetical protein
MLQLVKRPFLIFVVFYILLVGQISHAFNVSVEDLKNPDSKFFRYVNAYIVSSALYQEALKINESMHFSCSDEYHILPGEVTIIQPIIFDEKFQHPVSGLWLHRYRVERCGKEIIYNTYIASRKGAPPKIIRGVNGLTNVSLRYLLDVIISVYQYANTQYGPCPEGSKNPTPFVYDTELDTSTNSSDQKWSERWSVGICNKIVTIGINFDDTGKELKHNINNIK